MGPLSRRPLERGSVAVLLLGLLVVAGLAVLFGSTLTRSTNLEARVADASAAVERLQEQVEAQDLEVRFVETDAFVSQYARALGYGERVEIPFGLRRGSPSPAPIVPLGVVDETLTQVAPLDAWMDLLFGA